MAPLLNHFLLSTTTFLLLQHFQFCSSSPSSDQLSPDDRKYAEHLVAELNPVFVYRRDSGSPPSPNTGQHLRFRRGAAKQQRRFRRHRRTPSAPHSLSDLPNLRLAGERKRAKSLQQKGLILAARKRLSLYPTMGMSEEGSGSTGVEQQQQQTRPISHRPASSTHRRQQQHLNHHHHSQLIRLRGKGAQSDGDTAARLMRESIQVCLFLRSGCEKIRRAHYSQRLADFVHSLDVQERISNGFVIHRKPSEF